MRRRIRRRQRRPIYLSGSELEGSRGEHNTPNEELTKGGRALYDSETDRFNVKLEENSGDARMVANFPFIVSHTVLVRMQWFGAWCNIGSWDDSKVVLVCKKICNLSHGFTVKL